MVVFVTLPSVSVPLPTPSATMALKLPRKFNSQLKMYRARVGHTRIDDAEGNVGKRQGRRIIGLLRVHRTFNASINFISFFFVTSFSDN